MSDLFGSHIVGFPTRRLILYSYKHHCFSYYCSTKWLYCPKSKTRPVSILFGIRGGGGGVLVVSATKSISRGLCLNPTRPGAKRNLLSIAVINMSCVIKPPQIFAYAKIKAQISYAETAQLIRAFVFATWIVQSLFYLNSKFQASSHFL